MNKLILVVGLGGLGLAGYYFYAQSKKSNASVTQSETTSENTSNIFDKMINADIGDVINRSGTTVGVRNNNPANIKYYSPINWNGQQGSDAAGFIIFDTMKNGVRAAAINLNSYINAGYNTPRKITARWASGDSQEILNNYAKVVASRAGKNVDDIVTRADIANLLDGIIYFENGYQPLSQNDLYSYVAAAGF